MIDYGINVDLDVKVGVEIVALRRKRANRGAHSEEAEAREAAAVSGVVDDRRLLLICYLCT
jgi:hypothetical protein